MKIRTNSVLYHDILSRICMCVKRKFLKDKRDGLPGDSLRGLLRFSYGTIDSRALRLAESLAVTMSRTGNSETRAIETRGSET